MNVEQIVDFYQERKHRKTLLMEQLVEKQEEMQSLQKNYNDLIEARRIISEAARITQLQFKGFVETLVTMAIQTVFPEKQYKFVMEFDLKANRSEINLLVQQGEKDPYNPEDEQGGGLLDIISFALRVVMWSLENPRSRRIFVMDEPFRYCGRLTPLAGNMMKEISSKLGLQIIMVTHEDSLSEIADKCWFVRRENGGPSIIEEQGKLALVAPKVEKSISRIRRRR
jgi:DNA repair exonuclease SbcCD ATPase subunit